MSTQESSRSEPEPSATDREDLFARILSPSAGLPLPSSEPSWPFPDDVALEPRRWADGGDGDGDAGPKGDPVNPYDNIDDDDDDDMPGGPPDDAEATDADKGADDVAHEGEDVGDDIKHLF